MGFVPDSLRTVGRSLSVTMIALLVLSACSPAPVPGTTPAGTAAAQPTLAPLGTVTVRMEGDWPHLEVLGRQPGGGLQQGQITTALYDALVIIGPDPKDPTKPALLPYLAASWEQTPTKITFRIRTDATCQDGSKVTPSLIKENADTRLKNPTGIANIWGRGPLTTEANDAAGTFTMSFGTPFSDAIYGFLSYGGLPIVCPAGLKDATLLTNGAAGSGPYILESAVHGDQAVLKRRDDWKWGPNGITAKDLPEKIIFKVVTNETTAANLVLAGGLDVAKVGGADVPRLLNDRTLINKSATSYYNYPMVFNHDPARPTADIKVREALTAAIDINQWNQAANQGRGEISPSFLMPKADCFDASTAGLRVKDASPEKARQILLSAGWTARADGKLEKNGKPLTIVLVSGTFPGLGNGGEFLAAQWNKAGITVDSRITGDFNTFLQRGSASDFDAITTVYPFDQPNPNRAVGVYTGTPTPQGSNWSRSVNPAVETAIAAATSSVGAERCRHWGTVQKELLKNFSVVPLASPHVNWFTKGIEIFPGASMSDARFFRRAK